MAAKKVTKKQKKTDNKLVVRTRKGVVTGEASSDLAYLLKKYNNGIKLDIGCGERKMKGFVGMDIRKGPEVDIVHDVELFPWPIPDECASLALTSHLVEHINPHKGDARILPLVRLMLDKGLVTEKELRQYVGEYEGYPAFLRFMDEVWRVLKPGGQFIMGFPYAGSQGYWQDPTHVNPINEVTWAYFDPCDMSRLYYIYKPKPWKIIANTWHVNGNMEVILEKRLIDKQYGIEENN